MNNLYLYLVFSERDKEIKEDICPGNFILRNLIRVRHILDYQLEYNATSRSNLQSNIISGSSLSAIASKIASVIMRDVRFPRIVLIG